MATIANLFTWTTWIETTQTGTSYYGQAGYQASTNFVARSDAFTVSSYTCVTEITVSYSQNTHGTSTQVPLVLQVTNSSNGCINVNGPQGSSQGRATATVTPSSTVTYTLDYPLALNTGTDYYFWAYPNGSLSNFMEAKVFPISTRAGMKPSRMPPTLWNSFPRGKDDCRI